MFECLYSVATEYDADVVKSNYYEYEEKNNKKQIDWNKHNPNVLVSIYIYSNDTAFRNAFQSRSS